MDTFIGIAVNDASDPEQKHMMATARTRSAGKASLCFCDEKVEMKDHAEIRLMPGERAVVPPAQPHHVAPADGARCRFVIVQGVG